MIITESDVTRFMSKFEVTDSGCWIWTAGSFANGYGNFWVDGRPYGAHRVSWEIHNGPIPIGFNICHECDNPSCINPSHLFVGTQQDNMTDKKLKGRCGKPTSWGGHDKFACGHMRSVENSVTRKNGYSYCKTCKKQQDRAAYLRRKGCAAWLSSPEVG